MNYEKLTLDRFADKLKEGKYAGLTGARRAIGKTEWSDRDKKKALDVAKKHFESGGASAKPAMRPGPAANRPTAPAFEPAATRPALPAAPPRSSTLGGEVRVTTQAELIQTVDTMRQCVEALTKVAQLDPTQKPALATASKQLLDALEKLHGTAVREMSSSGPAGGRIVREVVREFQVPTQRVQPQTFVDVRQGDEDDYREATG